MLHNREHYETDRLRGVYRTEQDLPNITREDLGRFKHLENWVPGKIWSIKKKRGVDANVPGHAFTLGSCDTGCPINTIPEPQDLEQVHMYGESGTLPGGMQTRHWSFVDSDYIYTLEARGDMLYDNDAQTQLWRINIHTHETEQLPKVPVVSAQTLFRMLHTALRSERPMYGCTIGGGVGTHVALWSIYDNQRFVFRIGSGIGSCTVIGQGHGAVYAFNHTATSPTLVIAEWDFEAGRGAIADSTAPLPMRTTNVLSANGMTVGTNGSFPVNLVVTENFFYVTAAKDAKWHVLRVARDSLTADKVFDTTFPVASTEQLTMYAIDNNLVYLNRIAPGINKLYYLKNGDNLVEVGNIAGATFGVSLGGGSQTLFGFSNGCFYYSKTGGAGQDDKNIYKFCQLVCPGSDVPIGV